MKRALQIFVILILVAGASIWFARQYVLQQVVVRELKARHVPVQSLTVESLSKTHVVLRDVALGQNSEVKAAHADVQFTWDGTTLTAVDISLQQASIHAMMVDGGVVLGGIEALWIKAPPVDAAHASVPTTIDFSGDMTIHYEMSGVVRIALQKDTLELTREEAAVLLPLAVSGSVEGDLNKMLQVKLTFASEKNELQGTVQGSYDVAERKGKFDWETENIDFAPNGFEFEDFSPLFAEGITTFPVRVASEGRFTLNKGDWSVTPTVRLVQLPLANVLASALGEGTVVEGLIGGAVPVYVTPKGWKLQPANMNNIGGLHIAILPGSPSAQALSSHPQSPIVLGALSNFQVEQMTLDVKSTDEHGGITMQWHFVGKNPDYMGGKKVDFTLAVNANLEDMLRSTASAKSMVQESEKLKRKK